MFLMKSKKGAMNSDQIIGVLVAIILVVAVTLPIVVQVIADGNFSGTTLTILNIVPVLLAVVAIVLVANMAK